MGNTIAPRLENAEKTGVLQLSGLKLSKLPEEVKHLTKIRSLDLSDNRLELIKSWISNFKTLKVLNVDDNKIIYFPPEICSLIKLETLSANRNHLTSIILPGTVVNFGALQNLRFVHLKDNQLTDFPVEFCCAAIPINVIDLSGNRIAVVPSCVSELQAIEINLSRNSIAVIANTIAKCPRLKVLRLECNQLTLQSFPTDLFTDSQVSLLCVTENRFEMRDFYGLPGYSQYMDRFTAMKKKAI
ncbi:hypothetical protein P879_10978 [Paragonimus westermani]|uniref:Leucine-rich repeat-containing protein 57 n=1 Tax=Paragonimus westermani TaxID=34504 RepID=A0A8T0D8N0_9TREM|nr:hypothetical protein P879_10978 [Paragonimus westermani]